MGPSEEWDAFSLAGLEATPRQVYPRCMDPKTLGVAVNSVSFGLTLLAILLWLSGRMYPGFGRWTLGRVLAAFVTLIGIQSGVRSHWIVNLSLGMVGICDLILILEACREFMGLRVRVRWIYIVGACLYLSEVYIIVVLHSVRAGYVEGNLVGGAFSLACAGTILRYRELRQTGIWITGLSFSAATVAYVTRASYYVFHTGGTLLQSDPLNKGYLLFLLSWLIAVNFGFFLMHYERLLKDREEQSAQTERATVEMAQLKERGRSIAELARMEQEKATLEVKLIQAQKMESIGRLAGGVAHDFNNLLTVINGYSKLTLQRLAAGSPLRGNLVEIQKAGEQAAGLTRQLLAFSRKQILRPCTLDLNHVLNEMLPMLQRLVGEDVEVRVSCKTKSGMVRADVHQVEQVIMNLAVNASDAMPHGGRVLFETADVEREEIADGGTRLCRYVMLSVGDTGEGMDAETLERIFEPFFTTKEVGKGTGLGLSMVQGIVSQSGGQIDVHSELV
jgi:signal transduction histidine kinase